MNTDETKLCNLLTTIAERLSAAPPTPLKKDGEMTWEPSSSHQLHFLHSDAAQTVVCNIGPVPERGREDFYLLLMRANFLGQGTNDYILGMDKEEKFLTLSSKIPYDVDVDRLKEFIEDFVNFVDYWREELNRHVAQARGPFG